MQQVWTLQFEPAGHVLRQRSGGRPHPDQKSALRMKVVRAIDVVLDRKPAALESQATKKRNLAANANYNVPNNWRTARSTATVSFCDGTLAPAFVTVSHGMVYYSICHSSVLSSSVES